MPCIFCRYDGRLTREHVFPRWLRELFPDNREGWLGKPRRNHKDTERRLKDRARAMASAVERPPPPSDSTPAAPGMTRVRPRVVSSIYRSSRCPRARWTPDANAIAKLLNEKDAPAS